VTPRGTGLLPDHEFAAALGEITLAVLASRASTPASKLDALLALVARDVGWRATDAGAPPTDHDISWAWHQTTNLLRALNLLSTGGGWQDRSYGLTSAGRALALQCLHHRPTGPQSSLWA
jgi:hypothetical protein